MMRHYIYNRVKLIALTAVAGMVSSCVKEPLCESEHPHTSTVSFDYDWSKLQKSNNSVPDSMYIICDRVVYQETSVVTRDSETGMGRYKFLPSKATSQQQAQKTTDNTDFIVTSGEYKFLTLNGSSNTFDYTELLRYCKGSSKNKIPDLKMSYKTYSLNDKRIRIKDYTVTDYNDYLHTDSTHALFINPDLQTIASDSSSMYKINPQEHLGITFKPTVVTHDLNVYFNIKKNVTNCPFVIDSVYAIISGIPHSVNLRTRALDLSRTDKVLEKFRLVSPAKVPTEESVELTDTKNSTVVRCYKSLNVTGLVEKTGVTTSDYTGPGVMQLIIFCTTFKDDGTPQARKVINGLVNIHNAIKAANLQKYSYDLGHYTKARDKSTIYIKLNFTLDKKLIGDGDSDGVQKWQEGTELDADV